MILVLDPSTIELTIQEVATMLHTDITTVLYLVKTGCLHTNRNGTSGTYSLREVCSWVLSECERDDS
jgi:hypothetical protein